MSEPSEQEQREHGGRRRMSLGLMLAVLLIIAVFVTMFDRLLGWIGLGGEEPVPRPPAADAGGRPDGGIP